MRKEYVLAFILLVWAIIASTAAAYYYGGHVKYKTLFEGVSSRLSEVSVSVNIALDYNNGTRTWYNNTVLPLGATLLNATLKIAEVDYTIGKYGAFINSINNVENNIEKNMYWLWWKWSGDKWKIGEVACDRYMLKDEDTIIWIYQSTAKFPPEPPR